jgi:hypothetical protein
MLAKMWIKIIDQESYLYSLTDAAHRDVEVLLLLSNAAYYVA